MAPSKVSSRKGVEPVATPLAIAYTDAVEVLRHDRNMQRALEGVPLPLVFFILFVVMLSYHIPTSQLYEQSYSVSSVLASSGTDAITTDTRMKYQNIQTTSDVFDWLTDTFVPGVFVTEDYNGKLLTKDKWGRIASFNKVLGAVTFKVTRAPLRPCQAATFLTALYPYCYDAAQQTTDTRLISFDTNATEAADVVNKFKEEGDWLDFSTQQLLITVVTYNGELQGYTITKLQLDFHQGGYIEISSTTTPTISDPYHSRSVIALDVVVGLFAVVSLLSHLKRFCHALRTPRLVLMRIRKLQFGSEIMSVASCVGTIVFYVFWILMVLLMEAREFRDNLARLVVSGNNFDEKSNEREGLIAVTDSLEMVAQLTTASRLVATFTVFALGIEILMQFRFHPRLNFLTRTIANALHQFLGFFIVFLVIFVTFAVSGTVLFGDRVDNFSNISHTMQACVNMLFGNFDYDTIKDLSPPVGMLYYWAYMLVVSLVLLNMMLAIVLDAYQAMGDEAATSKYNVSLWRTLRNAFYRGQLYIDPHHHKPTERIAQYVDKAIGTKRPEIVFRGRVIPDELEHALGEPAAEGATLTEASLLELFPTITPDAARKTIAFLLAGCRKTKENENETRSQESNELRMRLPSSEGPLVMPLAVTPQDDPAGTEPIISTEPSELIARMETLQQKLDRMEALERKLDLLLSRENDRRNK